jgi:hypothetical protein
MAKTPPVYGWCGGRTRPRQSGSDSWTGLGLNWTLWNVQPWAGARLAGHVTNTSCWRMRSIHFTSSRKTLSGYATSNLTIGGIPAVCMLMDFIIPWLMTRMVIYPRNSSWLTGLLCVRLSCWGKWRKVLIRTVLSHSGKQTDLIIQTTWSTKTLVVTIHPAAPELVWSCYPLLAFQRPEHSGWIPGTHYRKVTNSQCFKTLLLLATVTSYRLMT